MGYDKVQYKKSHTLNKLRKMDNPQDRKKVYQGLSFRDRVQLAQEAMEEASQYNVSEAKISI